MMDHVARKSHPEYWGSFTTNSEKSGEQSPEISTRPRDCLSFAVKPRQYFKMFAGCAIRCTQIRCSIHRRQLVLGVLRQKLRDRGIETNDCRLHFDVGHEFPTAFSVKD